MEPSPLSTTELRDLPAPLADAPPELPEIPGGWTERSWTIAGEELSLLLPAAPDAFLDDAGVLAAHDRDGYMPYWAYLWPASLHMAAAILRRPWPLETPVLELGAGVGFVGLAAAKAGYRVTITDYDATAVQLALFNAHRSGLKRVSGSVLDWRHPAAESYPVILGCELLYEDRNHELLIGVLDKMLADDGVAWFGDGGRMRAERFAGLLPSNRYALSLSDEFGAALPALRVGQYQRLAVQRIRA